MLGPEAFPTRASYVSVDAPFLCFQLSFGS